jgi:hypothetical protein
MPTNRIEFLTGQDRNGLQQFAVTFAQLVAGLAVDPHGYFETKYTARIMASQSAEEINGVVAQLVQWIGSPVINNQERERLDRELARRELPSIADLRLHYLP